jgi:hypothetical protein
VKLKQLHENIKYRIYDKENKVMLAVDSIYFPLDSPSGKDLTCGETWYSITDVEIMQATGCHDRNGTRIYIGDILETPRGRVVIKNSATQCYALSEKPKNPRKFIVNWSTVCKGEIIGNYYENRELWQGK